MVLAGDEDDHARASVDLRRAIGQFRGRTEGAAGMSKGLEAVQARLAGVKLVGFTAATRDGAAKIGGTKEGVQKAGVQKAGVQKSGLARRGSAG
jgi:hypothetical protein